MSDIREIQGALDGDGKRFAVVASRFNARLVDLLVGGAVDCLRRHGVAAEDVAVVRVPGAFEVPLACEELAAAGGWDGLVALGVVVRGETPHFDYVCGEAARGVAGVSRRHRLPVGFGILTCDTSEQAAERAGGKAGNKGWEAAQAALEMANLLAALRCAEGVADRTQRAG
jgi:6,7-dimethyl-8-ribityllumazine synthase